LLIFIGLQPKKYDTVKKNRIINGETTIRRPCQKGMQKFRPSKEGMILYH
jgi:hypothetical protein